ncbi:MAG: ribonuclease E/G, partial [Paludibacteraceae bacterium]|nr:ribonuclease E/G [Paludibacteraceae bacterium]
INDKAVYNEVRSYLELIEPAKADLVKYYQDRLPIFDVYNITRQIKAAFGRVVSMKKGAYLVIEHTEAFHVIDVNSGTRTKSDNEQEDTAFEVNMMAVDEVARQMRLRDMGGIVVIDLIDMHTNEHKQQVYDRMRENMKNDSARHNVLPLSKFCLMQITRQRVRPVTLVDTSERCPTCQGEGKIRSSLLFTDMLESKLEMLHSKMHVHRATLYVHPYVYAYAKKGFPSLVLKWRMRYGWGIHICPNQNFALLQYEFRDSDGGVLDLSTPREMAE